jgi:hypothetical protein
VMDSTLKTRYGVSYWNVHCSGFIKNVRQINPECATISMKWGRRYLYEARNSSCHDKWSRCLNVNSNAQQALSKPHREHLKCAPPVLAGTIGKSC